MSGIQQNCGLPIPLQQIAESISKELPPIEAKKFFASLLEAISQDGKDLTNIHWKFLAIGLRSLPPQTAELQTIIDQVIDGMDLLSRGQAWDAAEAAEASVAARSGWWVSYGSCATQSARVAAAEAAEAAAHADDVDWAAFEASVAAYSIHIDADAYATVSDVGWVTAEKASRLRQRDLLLQLIKEAPIKTI